MSADDRSFMGWAAFGVALAALFLGFFAIAQTNDSAESAAGAGGGAAEVSVIDIELGSMKFVPPHIMAPPGQVQLRVTNVDSQVHNIAVLGAVSPDLQPGESYEMPLGELGVGVYPMLCEIPGHADGGMKGDLHIIANATPGAYTDGTAEGPAHLHGYATAEEMAGGDGRSGAPVRRGGQGRDGRQAARVHDERRRLQDLRGHREDRRLGGRARQGRAGLDLQRHGACPAHPRRGGATWSASCSRTSCPSAP
jgi:plastocyanin